jgi:hypothetical protein
VKYHDVYHALIEAVTRGILNEPFGQADFRNACPGFTPGTYRAFLWKHSSVGQDNGGRALLEKTQPGRFKLIRPFNRDF